MDATPVSLLERIRTQGDQEAWTRMVDLTTPLLFYWARRVGLQRHDAADLVQDVLALLVQKLPEFEYDPRRSFRSWLKTVTLNKWSDRRRRLSATELAEGDRRLVELAAPENNDAFWEVEYRKHLVARALEIMQSEFHPTTWKACWEHVVSGRSAAEVAAELGLTPGAVYVAKSRVLRRLRQELAGLMD